MIILHTKSFIAIHVIKRPLTEDRFLPLDEAIASRAVFVIRVGRPGGRAETLLEPAK